MASKKILAQLELQTVSSLTSPASGFVGFSAKADGLYQKIGTSPELRLLTTADVQNAILADGSITGAVSQAQIFTMGVKLYNLTQGYIPFASGTTKLLSNSPIYTDGANVGIGTTSPTASLHIKAGSATANTAPLKLTSGVNLTTPESGAIEFSSSRLYFTPSTTRETIAFMSDITSASHAPVTIGAIGSSPNANGMSISGQVLSLQPASALYGGILTNGAQTIAGAKTFASATSFTTVSYNYRSFTTGGSSNAGTARWSKLATFQTTTQYNNDQYEILLRSRYYAGKLYIVINSDSSVTTNLVDLRFISDFINGNVPDIQIYRSQDSTYLSTWDVYIYNPSYTSYEYAENNTRSANSGGGGKVVTFYQNIYEDPPVGSIAVSSGPYFNGIISRATGAKTTSFAGNTINNIATSSTASINKTGLSITSSGVWNGASAINTGLSVIVSGGTLNYAALFNGGNVGIGTASPVETLQVSGTIGAGNNLNTNGGSTVMGELRSYQANTNPLYLSLKTDTGKSGLFRSNAGFFNYYDTSNGNTVLDVPFAGASLLLNTQGTNRVTILSGGNVGIGNNLPISLLSVGSTSQFQVNTTGAIVAATGITSSGNINFSSLTASKVVFTNGSKNLTSTGIGTASQFIKGDGSLDSNTYITASSISGFVPYTGATQDVYLGAFSLTCSQVNSNSAIVGGIQIFTDYIQEDEVGIYHNDVYKIAAFDTMNLVYSYGSDKLRISDSGDVSIDRALIVGNPNASSYTDGGFLRIARQGNYYANFYFYSIDTDDEFGVIDITANPEEGINLFARTNDNSSNSHLEIRHWELGFYTSSQKRLEIAQSGSINAFGNTITSTGGFIGNASTATKLQTARTITVGNKTLSFDGTENISFPINEIGFTQTRLGSDTYSYLSGDIVLQGSGKIFVNQMGQFITVNSYGYTKEDVGLGNVTNNAQWHNGNHPTTLAGYGITDIVWSPNYHPTTIAGYGITDALTVSGLTTHNIPKWNGTTFVNSPLMTNSVNSYVYTNVLFVSNVALAAPNISLTDNGLNAGKSYIGYDRFTENSNILLIGAGYDQGYISILPENEDGLNVMVGSMSGARDLYVTGGTSTSSIALRSGAVTGYYLRCVNTNGVAEWAPVTVSQIYKGTWNASTNSPTLSNGSGTAGWYYRVTTAGTFNSVAYSVGDDIIYNGSIWERIPGAGYSLQTASTTVLGGVKIDGTSVKLNGSNQLYVSTNYEAPLTFTGGLSRTGNTVSFTGSISGFVPYTGATMDVDLGSRRLTVDNIRVTTGSGSGKVLMDVTGQGHAAWMPISSLPVASSTVIGGIKVGYGLQIDAAVLSVNPGVFVPYTGADRDVNLASYSIYAYDFLIYSDINLKCNIEDIEMKKLDINYKQFEYKTSRGEKRYGVIAQELLSIAPEFVSESNNSYAVKYTDLLIYEVAQLKEEVKQLKSLLCR